MTTAILLPPALTLPVPSPDVSCYDCDGLEADPDFETRCGTCGGTGVAAQPFRLTASRAHEYRLVTYQPKCSSGGELCIELARRSHSEAVEVAEYRVDEFEAHGGRGFAVLKKATGELRHVFIGPKWGTCDCKGGSYDSAGRANRKAYERGGKQYPTTCKHLDAVKALVEAGWFDLEG